MSKSKDISNFVSAKISELRPDEEIPTDLYLYFSQNRRILLWKTIGTVFTPQDLEKLHQDGLETVWVHTDDWKVFEAFLNPFGRRAPEQTEEHTYEPKISATSLLDLIRGSGAAQGKNDREKIALVALAARSLLSELTSATHLSQQKAINDAITSLVKEVITATNPKNQNLAQQIWQLASRDHVQCRAVTISNFSVLFSMAFGHIDESVLADVCLASLIQGVGVTQLPLATVQKKTSELSEEDQRLLLSQASITIQLIEHFSPDFAVRAKTLLPRPGELKTEIAQIIAMAVALDSWCSGAEDGVEKTVMEGLTFLELSNSEKPGRFNTERLSALVRWINDARPLAA